MIINKKETNRRGYDSCLQISEGLWWNVVWFLGGRSCIPISKRQFSSDSLSEKNKMKMAPP